MCNFVTQIEQNLSEKDLRLPLKTAEVMILLSHLLWYIIILSIPFDVV